ncbi:MAG: MG2 domain-containing protein, partial [Cyclobacteriaceae bacterium]|nr:MG2 domain-containing protein [Cyclobacteriaceae bacterium]
EEVREHPVSGEITFLIAEMYYNKGLQYKEQPSGTNRVALKKAHDLCTGIVEKFPDSYGASQCRLLLSQINEKSLLVITEKINNPAKPFRALLSYKNLEKVYCRVVKADWDADQKAQYRDREKFYERIKNNKAEMQWEVSLGAEEDYQEHATEIKVEGLPKGYYYLLVATSGDFSTTGQVIAFTPLWVSNLAYLDRTNIKGEKEFHVFNRESGEPLKGVKAELFYEKYNYVTRQLVWKKFSEYITNKEGLFRVNPTGDGGDLYVNLTIGDDRLSTGDSHYLYKSHRDDSRHIRTLFFADRAIYRPGQTLHFKGIVMDTDGKNNNIKVNFNSTVTFYDVNNQKISEVKLTTNEYGSFSGSFTIPDNGLNGRMYIKDDHGMLYISVEEYKRPQFEVTFNPVKGSYKLEERMKIEGVAKTYSGAALDGVEVTYRVVRRAYFPYYSYWRGYRPYSKETEIAHGNTITSDVGEFAVEFMAVPDPTVSREHLPTYQYAIYADVTDINGETHGAVTHVQVGYNALDLTIEVPEKVNKSGKDRFDILSANLNGEFEPASGNIKIWSLKMPDKYYRERLWDSSDRYQINERDYKRDFPLDVYKNEDKYKEWEKVTKVYDRDFNTADNKEITLNKLPEWASGYYVLEATSKDAFGQEVKKIQYMTVFDENEKSCPVNEIGWFVPLKTRAEPGETVDFLIGSAAKGVKVLFEIQVGDIIVHEEWLSLSAAQKKVTLPVEEKHRGNFAVYFTFVRHGRSFQYNQNILVPYTNKVLDLSFSTFRSTLLPGQQEEWTINITDKKGEKAAAEMVAALYDASLDAFASNTWFMDILHYNHSYLSWNNNTSFSMAMSNLLGQDWNNYDYHEQRRYDELNWFGYGYYSNRLKSMAIRGYAARAEFRQEIADGNVVMEDSEEVLYDMIVLDEDQNEPEAYLSLEKEKSEAKPGDKSFDETDSSGDKIELETIKARENFNETAFFYPHLTTNDKGETLVKFTLPESLTRWKFMALAHTKDLKTGYLTGEVIARKDLMVYPNAPRFFREGDTMLFSTKITNLSGEDLMS